MIFSHSLKCIKKLRHKLDSFLLFLKYLSKCEQKLLYLHSLYKAIVIISFFLQVAELKRANGLYSDQDFHALKTLKIPVQAHGLLTEIPDKKQKPALLKITKNEASTSTDIDDNSDYEDIQTNRDCVRTVSIRSALDSPNSFLEHMDNDLKLICKSTPLRKTNLDEVTRTLTINCINPLKLRKQQDKSLGTACGIGWKGLIIIVFFVGILLPGIIAFIYLRKKDNLR